MRGLPRYSTLVRRFAPLVIVAAGVAGLVALAGLRKDPAEQESIKPQYTVATVPVRHSEQLTFEVDGVVMPWREVPVTTQVAGRVLRKSELCEAGRYVSEGTLLAQLDPRDYELQVQQLRAQREMAEISLEEIQQQQRGLDTEIALATEEVELAGREVQRFENLLRARAVSPSAVDQVRAAVLTARNNAQSLRNQRRVLEARQTRLTRAVAQVAAQLEQAELNLQRTTIRAPISGVILEDQIEENGYLQAGTAIAVIEDVSAAEVRCELRMEQLDWIWRAAEKVNGVAPHRGGELPPTSVTVHFRLGSREYTWNGQLSHYAGSGVDPSTRTVPCRVRVDTPYRPPGAGDSTHPALVRGMFVQVQIHVPAPPSMLLQIPESALRPGNRVWTVQQGKLREREVQLVRLVPQSTNSVAPSLPDSSAPASSEPIVVDGMTVPSREVALAAEVSGRIVKKSPEARAGKYVTQGTVLFEIDQRDYMLQVEQLEEELQQAIASTQELKEEIAGTEQLIAVATEQLQVARRELQRQLELTSAGTSESEMDQARRNELTARRALLALQNQLTLQEIRQRRYGSEVQLAETQLAKARIDLQRTGVAAPFDAVIVNEAVEEGAFVAAGTDLILLEDAAALEVACMLQPEQLYSVWQQPTGSANRLGQSDVAAGYELEPVPARILYELNGRRYAWQGELWRVHGVGLNTQTRTAEARIRVSNAEEAELVEGRAGPGEPLPTLMRGMFVKAEITPPAEPRILQRSAIHRSRRGADEYVAILDATTSELTVGDRVVVSPLGVAQDGMAVQEQIQE